MMDMMTIFMKIQVSTTIYDELFSREILGKTQAAYFYEYLIFSADSPFSTEIFQNYPFNHNNFF